MAFTRISAFTDVSSLWRFGYAQARIPLEPLNGAPPQRRQIHGGAGAVLKPTLTHQGRIGSGMKWVPTAAQTLFRNRLRGAWAASSSLSGSRTIHDTPHEKAVAFGHFRFPRPGSPP